MKKKNSYKGAFVTNDSSAPASMPMNDVYKTIVNNTSDMRGMYNDDMESIDEQISKEKGKIKKGMIR